MCKTWRFLFRCLLLTVLFQSCIGQKESLTHSDDTTTLLDESSALLDGLSTIDVETSTSPIETSPSPTKPPKLNELLRIFSNQLEITILAEEAERNLSRRLMSEFQIDLVKKMTDFRLQMVVHRNHSFGQNYNEKWVQCLKTKSKKIKELEEEYAENESVCVQQAQKEVSQQKQAVRQIVKETRKWRKGYRYLHFLCKESNMLDKESNMLDKESNMLDKERAGDCFVDYMQKDKYDDTITRLLMLLEKAQSDLKTQVEDSLRSFDACLQNTLSNFLESVRRVMDMLSKCYKRKLNAVSSRADNNTGCVMNFSRLKCTSI